MNEIQAKAVAEALGFEARHTGGNLWTCSKTLPSGKVVMICDDVVLLFSDEATAQQGERYETIIEFTEA